MELSIHPTLGLVVSAPVRASRREIDAFVRKKARWARRAIETARARDEQLQRRIVSGETLPYLDGRLELAVLESQSGVRPRAERNGDRLCVHVPAGASAEERLAVIEGWYREQAQHVFSERVTHFAALAGAQPGGVAVRSQKSRWGSCGKRGTLYFNWRLLLAPAGVLDYLVIHELCHLRQRGHGRRFWRLVERVLPDFAEREATLRRDGWRYRLSAK